MTSVSHPDAARLPVTAVHAQAITHQYRRLAAMSQPAWLHQEVGRRLAEKMTVMRMQPQHWLDWGGWLGAGRPAVKACYPHAKPWVWEPTNVLRMKTVKSLEQAQSKSALWRQLFNRSDRIEQMVYQGDEALPPNWPHEGVGLMWANMALHASIDLPSTMRRWHAAMSPEGFLMCSGLGPDTAKELKGLYRQMAWAVPAAAFLDMHDVGDALIDAGFAEPVMDMEHLTLTWPSAQHMLDELRTWGGNVAVGRIKGCRTPRWREKLLSVLTERLSTPDGRLALTVEVVYGHAIKPTPRVLVSAETKVSLNDMRQLLKQSSPERR